MVRPSGSGPGNVGSIPTSPSTQGSCGGAQDFESYGRGFDALLPFQKQIEKVLDRWFGIVHNR